MNLELDTCTPGQCAKPIFIARQPIFDRQRNIWGYEVFFRSSGEAETAEIENPDLATAGVIVDGFPMASVGMELHQKLAVNFTRNMVLKDFYGALPGERCVADLPPKFNDPEYLQGCKKLKEHGFMIATEAPAKTELVKLADIIRIDVSRFEAKSLMNAAMQLKKLSCISLAQKVEDKATYQMLLDLNFDLFQGFFFSKPEVLPGSAPNTSKLAKLRILQELQEDDFSNEEITKMISSDVGLSYRLIRFINSPYFGFSKRITSISHAISLLGQMPLKQWLMAASLSDITEGDHGKEIYFTCMKRARFMEQLGEKSAKLKANSQSLFLLGLFSKLDVLLSQPMETLVEQLNLEENISKALCGEKNLFGLFLELAEGIEQAKWEELTPYTAKLGLKTPDVAISHNMAVLWATEIMAATK